MPLLSLQFLALLLTAILLGGTTYFTAMIAPLVFAKLGSEAGGRFIRQVFPYYYGASAALAFAATLLGGMRLSSFLLGFAGFGFLFALLWLMPAIRRYREKGETGDEVATATFQSLHRASVALNALQILVILGGFALLATG